MQSWRLIDSVMVLVISLSSLALYGAGLTASSVVVFALLAILAYLLSPGITFVLFGGSALVLASVKRLAHRDGYSGHLATYSPRNFLCAGLPPILLLGLGRLLGAEEVAGLAAACSLGTIVADTVASDIGVSRGADAYMITDGRRVEPGTDGAISMKGTLAGLLALSFFALLACIALANWQRTFLIVVLCGTIGTVADSFLGATLQSAGRIGNETVNALSSAFSALCSVALWFLRS